MIEVGEVAQPAPLPRRAPGVLEVEQNRAILAHQDVSVVKVSVDEPCGVELGDAGTEQGKETAPLPPRRGEYLFQGAALDVAQDEQAVPVRETTEGERLGHANPCAAEPAQGAPLAHGGRAADAFLQGFA